MVSPAKKAKVLARRLKDIEEGIMRGQRFAGAVIVIPQIQGQIFLDIITHFSFTVKPFEAKNFSESLFLV